MRRGATVLLLISVASVASPELRGTSSARAQDERDEPDRAGEQLERARALFEQGQRAYTEGRLQEAARKMKKAYRLTRSPELAFNVARVFERMGEAELAITYFRIYMRHEEHHGRLGEDEREELEKRIQALREMAERRREQLYAAAPSDDALTREAHTFFERGVALYEQGHYEAAMQAFTAAHRFAPLPEIFYNLALTSEKLERWRDARDYYREYLRVRPAAPDREHVERKIEQLRRRR